MTDETIRFLVHVLSVLATVAICARAFRPTRGEAGTVRPLPDPRREVTNVGPIPPSAPPQPQEAA